ILEAASIHEWIALEVEEEIARRRLRKTAQSAPRLDRQQLVRGAPLRSPSQLDARLLPRSLQRVARTGAGTGKLVEGPLGERCQSRRAVQPHMLDLMGQDSGNQREMIVLAPAGVARLPPFAYVAMRDLLRITGGRTVRQMLRQPLLDRTEVRVVVRNSKTVGGESRAGTDHVHPRRLAPEQPFQEPRIDAQLEDGAAARLVGELGVGGFVRPGAERALFLDAKEQVRAPSPDL